MCHNSACVIFFFFFCDFFYTFLAHFFYLNYRVQPITSVSNNCTIYHQNKTLISFQCRQKLNTKSLIQLLKTLSIELVKLTPMQRGEVNRTKGWTNML